MPKCYVYAWRNINNGKMNIGYKSPNGEEHTYITSLKNMEFWKDYSYGLLKKSILYIGNENEANIAKSVEWFALNYAVKTAKDRLYNPGNNANKGEENLIPKFTKQLIVDYIEGKSDGISPLNKDEDADFVEQLSKRIKEGEFQVHNVPRVEIEKYSRNQVRTKDKVIEHIHNIRTKIVENPDRARNIFGPIIVAVKNSGEKMIVDGNSRFAATEGVVGWEILPVIYINESEFGETELQRQDNYDLVGLYENRAPEEIKEENSWSDLKRNIVNYLVRHNIDLSKTHHVDHARQIIYERFLCVCESKHQLNGILKSILNDFDKSQAELKYEKNLISYDERYLEKLKWNKYTSKDISCVIARASEAKFMKAIGYVQHSMFNDKLSKGAIVFHFTSKNELVTEENEKWIEKLKKVIKYHNLSITVEVLPAFEQ